jgi:hypothetical protein
VIILAVLSLLPAQNVVRTGMPGELEHSVAYAGSASIAIAGYGRGVAVRIVGLFWIYAALLGYLQHFSPGRHPSIGFFAVGARSVVRRARCTPARALPMKACISGRRLI